MSRRWGAWTAVLVSLLVVGVVRTAIPQYLPSQSQVAPNGNGLVALALADVELLEARASSHLQTDGSTARELATDEVFVVARVRITPRGGTLRVVSDLQSADGRTYRALDINGFPHPGVAYVGQSVTATHIFEVPEGRVAGAHLVIRGSGEDGVQAIQPVTWFPVDPSVEPGVLTVAETIVEPAR